MKKKYLLLIILLFMVVVVFATYIIVFKNEIKYLSAEKLTLYSEDKMGMDKVWCETFQIAWNELTIQNGKDISFKDEESKLALKLNEKSFTKDMLQDKDYYIKIQKSPFKASKLKKEIYENITEKFGDDNSNILGQVDFNTPNGTIIYSTLRKSFHFLENFDNLDDNVFVDNKQNKSVVKYFGKDQNSDEKLLENMEVLYDNGNEEYIIKLKTKENEEIILYKTKQTENLSFEELYDNVINLSENFEEKDKKIDVLQIPYINLKFAVNYDGLCGKVIEGTDGEYIAKALQTIDFSLDATGGKVQNGFVIKTEAVSDSKAYKFDSPFVLFIKEKDSPKPYFAIKIVDTEFLDVQK